MYLLNMKSETSSNNRLYKKVKHSKVLYIIV